MTGVQTCALPIYEVACYVVEVCTSCYWNHLAQRYLLGRRHVG